MMRNLLLALAVIVTGTFLLVNGCDKSTNTKPYKNQWYIEQVGVIDGLNVPECVVIDTLKGSIYVSSIVTSDKNYWGDDNNGFISLIKSDGQIDKLKWLESSADMLVHNPKGMCILNRKLYFNDNTKLKYISLEENGQVGEIIIKGTQKLNDIATDGESVWVTDTEAGRVLCVSADGSIREIPAPEKVNGITCYQGKIFAVSWSLHEIYELDPTGVKEPVPFGLSDNFTALDSIEVLVDNSFIVTDFKGNRLCWVSADRKTVHQLAKLTSPADVGYDRTNNLLYIPQFLKNRVMIYKLTKQSKFKTR